MNYPAKVVLLLPLSRPAELPPFVETCVRDGVEVILIQGEGAEAVEDAIDGLIVGDGSASEERYICTGAFAAEPLEDVLEIAASWVLRGDGEDRVVQVRL